MLAHELGGIASALDLRAHVISSTISETDLKALRDLTEELRTTTRTIRLVRGTDGSGTLNPGRRQTLADWWKTASRFVAHVLPRGTLVAAEFPEHDVSPEQTSPLLWLLLAGLKDLSERGLVMPCTIHVTGEALAAGSGMTLLVEVPADRVDASGETRISYAAQLAEERGLTPPLWEIDGATLRWRCSIGT